jgi:hypothetical protein
MLVSWCSNLGKMKLLSPPLSLTIYFVMSPNLPEKKYMEAVFQNLSPQKKHMEAVLQKLSPWVPEL